ncbi:MAG: N-formylglutamate amidohydrolase [Hyphomonadaceae bacterium]|nr:N-formylglutamate amidohydrolase [Hyphomonadaceae bacterium]
MDFASEPAAQLPAVASEAGGPAPEDDPPFLLISPLKRTSPLIFASPHSGRRYPKDFLAQARVGLSSLRRSEDAYVDEIFAGAAGHGAPILSAAYARAYVDLNRDPGELDPDMFADYAPAPTGAASARVQAGLGAIPRIAGDGQAIYARKLPLADAERRIAIAHRPYHAMLRALIEEARAAFGCAVLIDCHSMPSCARGPNAPDVVLGDRFGMSCHPSVTSLVEAILQRLGYRVARNAPFAGGHTTQIHGRPGRRVHALQIEINRGLYLDEKSLQRTQGFLRVRADMARLGEALAIAKLHQSLA